VKGAPPRLARWILERALPDDVRQDVSGDLEENFRRRRRTVGAIRSRLWYLAQALSFATHFFAERLRNRSRAADMSTGFSWMDFKLGFRMLVRYPGLTLVGVFGMAIAIAIAAGASSTINRFTDPALPLDAGDRIITVLTWDAAKNGPERRVLHDDIRDAETGRLYRSVKYLMSLLLLVVCVNVSILVYARTATRQGEIAVRSALGASRKRVVAQLFIEALVLSAAAALVGLGITSVGLRQVNAAMTAQR